MITLENNQKMVALSKRVLFLFISCLAVALMSVSFAFANNPTAVNGEWGTYIENLGNIIHWVALTGGAVGLAWCGVEYAYGNEETSNKAKAKAFIIFASVGALYILPYIVELGMEVAQRYKWNPSQLG